MKPRTRGTLIGLITVLGVQAPFWWVRDLATLVWPVLDEGGMIDLTVSLAVGLSALAAGFLVLEHLVRVALIEEVRDES